MFEILFSFAIATFILAISPGPDNLFVLTQSVVNGKKFGLATVLGLMTGCLLHTSFVAFGVSAIIEENESVFLMIKLFGVSYLLYLAFKVYQANANIVLSEAVKKNETVFKMYKKGLLMNVLNPKVTTFFIAFFPQFLFSESVSTVLQFYILGAIFIVISFLVFSTIAVLAGTISNYLTTSTNIGTYLKWGQIILFVLISIMILL
jgi:threonine/homoserine/homoserine lactone efflux protein